MTANKQYSIVNLNYLRGSYPLKKLTFIFLFLTGAIFYPIQIVNSEELFLKCTGTFEINRGALIKPDWEISYITINLKGLKSSIVEKGVKKEGRTLIRRNIYTITHRDISKRIKTKYKIDGNHSTYIVDYPQQNRTLIGTCEKGKG